MTDLAASPFSPPAPATSAGPAFVHLSGDTQMRLRIIQGAISMFHRFAFHDASFDLVAASAKVTVGEVTDHFPTWEGLLVATIDYWNGQRMRPILPLAQQHGAVMFLRGIVQANIEDPSLMRLLSATVNIAATPEHPMASFLHQEWHRFHLMVAQQLTADIRAGREPATMEPARGAEQLIALYEGLQLQSMVRPAMNLLEAYDRAVTRMRAGWTREYIAPVWDLDSH
ncbi:TetR/AcrR family transcriptional regulator [Frondihabitans sp. PhB188]|uniref:TetR/AcrR family transcriptional regulator n=1 Tax=Frondihabitans sp. PhB188 TaxID=2485200 RepID=UPI000F46C4DD|nr:TetR/AcrR family transcriptional regulator [Frondihabitans sp. PhB188]